MNRFIDSAARNILDLHALVASWVRGGPDSPPVAMDAFLANFHPEFVMIAPAGRRHGREALAKSIIDAIDSGNQLDITIVDLELVHASGDMAVFLYEEHRHTAHHFRRRISSATFVRGEQGQPLLRLLQETWIED